MNKEKSPVISVLMCVYCPNEEYLKIAIESILDQSYTDFEFLIVIDGEDPYIESIINRYNDKRIKVHINPTNYGLTKSLNIGISLCSGKYIARMDADDYSYKNRLEEQFEFMEKNEDVVVVGCYAKNIGKKGFVTQLVSNKMEIEEIRMMFYNAGIVHPSAFIRKEILTKYNIKYDERIKKSQDYALWSEIIKFGKIKILSKILFGYRRHKGQIICANSSEVEYYTSMIRKRLWNKVGVNLSSKEVVLLNAISTYNVLGKNKDFKELFGKLAKWNRKNKYFNEKYFQAEIDRLWLHLSIKRFLHDGKVDMLLSLNNLKVFKLYNIVYCTKFYFIDKYKPYIIGGFQKEGDRNEIHKIF